MDGKTPVSWQDGLHTYYQASDESSRLYSGEDQLEQARTRQIIGRYLPSAPAEILDVGGAGGRPTGQHPRR